MRQPGWALVCVLLVASSVGAQEMNDKLYIPASHTAQPFNDAAMFNQPIFPHAKPPKPDAPLWCGGVEFGLNGSEGNSDVFKMRLGTNAKRTTENNLFTVDLTYGLANQNGVRSENKALFNARDEVLFRGGPWGVFASTQVEYDEFRAFDFRVAAHTGVGYQLLCNETTNLRGRLGAGFSREIGGPQDRWVPEGLAGLDFEHKLSARQRLIATVDFFPDLGDYRDYRIRSRAAWEVLVDPEWNLTLRLGVQDRFDSNPGPAKRNDIDYFLTLLFKF